jgi:hypothetical protein
MSVIASTIEVNHANLLLDRQKPILALSLMLLDPKAFYHQGQDGERDSEWKNELQAAQKMAKSLCIQALKLKRNISLKDLRFTLQRLIQMDSPWIHEGKEEIVVPSLEQVVEWDDGAIPL